jgi:hypothetical protein
VEYTRDANAMSVYDCLEEVTPREYQVLRQLMCEVGAWRPIQMNQTISAASAVKDRESCVIHNGSSTEGDTDSVHPPL